MIWRLDGSRIKQHVDTNAHPFLSSTLFYSIQLDFSDKMTVKNAADFSMISVKPLHSTFAAEVSGVDFSSALSDEVFQEVFKAVTKV